jgi:hypothetical protein
MREHHFGEDGRCRWCGTPKTLHDTKPQDCPHSPVKQETRRRVSAVDDIDAIYDRIKELETERSSRS